MHEKDKERKKIMEVLNLKLNEIHPYEKNPRNNKDAVDGVAASIREFGFKVPIIIDKDNIIVAGHTRFLAAKKLGLEQVPCIKADDLTPEQIKAFRLADNKVAEKAEWDFKLLGEELADITMDMEQFGFELLGENIEILEDDVPDIPEVAKSKPGDIYKLGKHTLMCGDSTKLEDVEKLMNGVKADLLITDPPYNVDYEGSNGMKIQNDKFEEGEEFCKFLTDAFNCANDVMKSGAVFYIWHADVETYNFIKACKNVNWKVRQFLIWVKSSLVLGMKDYQTQHEPCLYGWKEGSHLWASDRKQTTILNFDKPKKNDIHPTMKPIALFDYEIRNNTKQDDVVLDLFGGSGTTIMACEQDGRVAYSMELDPRYVDAIVERWENFTGRKAVLING
jgi:site-specific DNA-methyltransferase (adenine-specific)